MRLAAAATAAVICVCMSGCGNAIEYKTFNTSSSQPESIADSSSVPDSSVTDSAADSSTDSKDDSKDDSKNDSKDDSSEPVDEPADNTVKAEDDPEYLTKTAFVGEALCSGLLVYTEGLEEDQVYTENNAHVDDIADTTWDVGGKQYELPDALYESKRTYIYLWLGPNDVSNYAPAEFAQKYQELIEKIFYANPLAYVGVVSVAPVSAEYDGTLPNGKIYDYNAKLAEMIDKIGNNRVYFFNVTTVLGDSNGNLKSEYDSGDGVHMTGDAYRALLDNLVSMQIHPYLTDFETPDDSSSKDDKDSKDKDSSKKDKDKKDDTESKSDDSDSGEESSSQADGE